MPTHTVRLHRVLRAPAERIYRAYLDPDAMVKWLPPHGFTGKVHEMDARVGGSYRMSFTNLGTGKTHSLGGKYVVKLKEKLKGSVQHHLILLHASVYAVKYIPRPFDFSLIEMSDGHAHSHRPPPPRAVRGVRCAECWCRLG